MNANYYCIPFSSIKPIFPNSSFNFSFIYYHSFPPVYPIATNCPISVSYKNSSIFSIYLSSLGNYIDSIIYLLQLEDILIMTIPGDTTLIVELSYYI